MELWAYIDGYPNYQVSDLGRVRSFRILKGDGTTKEIILKQNIIKGYHNVTLYKGTERNNARVNRLVAIAFIPNPENKPQVNHKRGLKFDNRAIELEWSTCSENAQHAYDIGLRSAPKYTGTFDKPVISIKDTSLIEHKSRSECSKYTGTPKGSFGKLVDSGKSYNGYFFYSL